MCVSRCRCRLLCTDSAFTKMDCIRSGSARYALAKHSASRSAVSTGRDGVCRRAVVDDDEVEPGADGRPVLVGGMKSELFSMSASQSHLD